MPRRPGVATAAAGGRHPGLRAPAHPVARAVLGTPPHWVCGRGGASANRLAGVSPTLAQHVVDEFGAELLVLDGGACDVGIESSIVDCSGPHPVLLRPARSNPAASRRRWASPWRRRASARCARPGTLVAHHAPRATVRLYLGANYKAAWPQPVTKGCLRAGGIFPARPSLRRLILRPMLPDAASGPRTVLPPCASWMPRALCEIWVEAPPPDPAWDGVRDRLSRAAATFTDAD